jgi:hypothetical protein
MAFQIQKTDDPNAAVEAALAACATKEDALFVLLQTQSNMTRDEAMNFRPFLKAKLKAQTLDIARNRTGTSSRWGGLAKVLSPEAQVASKGLLL